MVRVMLFRGNNKEFGVWLAGLTADKDQLVAESWWKFKER